jgi:hypothetical protein
MQIQAGGGSAAPKFVEPPTESLAVGDYPISTSGIGATMYDKPVQQSRALYSMHFNPSASLDGSATIEAPSYTGTISIQSSSGER